MPKGKQQKSSKKTLAAAEVIRDRAATNDVAHIAHASLLESPSPWIPLAALFALVLLMFGDVLFFGGNAVPGAPGTDLFSQFVAWREFGFRELAHGNLALWNPHVYCGAPFFGGMQAALLYPPNVIFLLLPIAAAINWSIALHVFALGAFMFFWMRKRGLHMWAAFFAGAVTMFCGAHFPHVYAGHLPNLCAMIWTPLIFLSIDSIFARVSLGACLLGVLAAAMQIFAGHPQYVFYTAIAAAIYSLLRLIELWRVEKSGRALTTVALALLTIYPGGALLAAVQLFTAAQATAETIRDAPLSFAFASMFAFPPENFLTLITPGFFGEMQSYWGRCYLWEMSIFVGVTGFALAVYAVVFCEGKRTRIFAAMTLLLLLLAIGKHTPLFALLYRFAPGFNKFRGVSKFTFPATLFLVGLSATGLDRLFKQKATERNFVVAMFAAASVIGIAACAVFFTSAETWRGNVAAVLATGESYLPRDVVNNAAFVAGAHDAASDALLLSLATTVALAFALLWTRKEPRAVFAIVALGVLEMFVFARGLRPTFDLASVAPPELKKFLAQYPGDYRILNPLRPNNAMLLGADDLWGNDPSVVRRYAEFMTWSQGGNPNDATQYVNFARLDPIYALLRLRFAFIPQQDGVRVYEAPAAPLPRVKLVSRYEVASSRDAIFARMRASGFEPGGEVILEKEPEPRPAVGSGPVGDLQIVSSSTDAFSIEANLSQPAILLITDVYTRAWRAVALPGSSQTSYDLQPADYVLRAVPLAAGHHKLRVEYAPREFVFGKWISIIALLAYAGAAGVWLRRRFFFRQDLQD